MLGAGGHAHESRATTQRRLGRHHHGTGHAEIASDHQHFTVQALVGGGRSRRQQLEQRRQFQPAEATVDACVNLGWHLEIVELHFPGMVRPLQQEQTAFQPDESHCYIRAHRATEHPARVCTQARGYVYRQHWRITGIDRRYRRCILIAHIAAQAGTEHRVDQHARRIKHMF